MQRRLRQSGWSRQSCLRPDRQECLSQAYTLVEMLVVMGIILLLSVMTIGAINLSITSERVRSGARQVQSLIEGARDRAIYARAPRGIRILVNDTITEDHDGDAGPPIGASGTPEIPMTAATLVYIGSPGQDESQPDRDDVNRNGDRTELFTYVQMPDTADPAFSTLSPAEQAAYSRMIIGTNTNWATLYERGLIGPGSSIRIDGCEYKIDPRSFPIARESDTFFPSGMPRFGGFGGTVLGSPPQNNNGVNPFVPPAPPPPPPGPTDDEVLYLLWTDGCVPVPTTASPGTFLWNTPRLPFSIDLEPDVLPGEEASVLPKNVVIDLETSHLPESWVTRTPTGVQYSNNMDIVFSPSGAIIGETGAAGLIHLHVCDVGDAITNVPPGSQTLDGLPDGEPRNGDEFGITIFTRSGRVITHPIDWSGYPVPGSEAHNIGPPTPFVDAADFDNNPRTLGYWQRDTAYTTGDIVAPPLYNGLVFECTVAGTTGGSPPTWNLAPGGFTVDGGATWRSIKHNIWDFGTKGDVAK